MGGRGGGGGAGSAPGPHFKQDRISDGTTTYVFKMDRSSPGRIPLLIKEVETDVGISFVYEGVEKYPLLMFSTSSDKI